MPIYEFKCKKCGNVFEYLCFNSRDEETAKCPSCGANNNEKLLSTFSSASSGSNEGFGSGLGSASCSPSGGFS